MSPRIRLLLIGTAIVLVAVVLQLIPVRLPYSVTATGKVMPVRQWVLSRGNDGQLIATVHDYRAGVGNGYSVSQFAREGSMRFDLSPAILTDRVVSAGDTIGTIRSSETEERLVDLRAKLAVARAELVAEEAPQKDAVIREYERRHSLAVEEAAEQHRILERLTEMRSRNLVSLEEYELAESETAMLDIRVSIARSQLDAVRSGEKPQQIGLIRSRISGLEEEIDMLQRRFESFSLTAPLPGRVSRSFSPDTILTVSDTTEYVVAFPVNWADYHLLYADQPVSLTAPGAHHDVAARLLQPDREVMLVNREPAVLIIALVADSTSVLVPGMAVGCTVRCQPVTLMEYGQRLLESLLG